MTRRAKEKVKEASQAFDSAFETETDKIAPTNSDNWDAGDFDPHRPEDESKVRVHVKGGETISIEESDKALYAQLNPTPETPIVEEVAPLVDNVPEKPLPPVESPPVAQETPLYTKEQSRQIILALIDGMNHLYPLAKRKVLGKDIPRLMERVARGRQLISQIEKEIQN